MEVGVVRRVGDVDDSEEEVDVEERVEVVRGCAGWCGGHVGWGGDEVVGW